MSHFMRIQVRRRGKQFLLELDKTAETTLTTQGPRALPPKVGTQVTLTGRIVKVTRQSK